MACKLKMRRDDIPKRKGEKTWVCDTCHAIVFSAERPKCQEPIQVEIAARRASADADFHIRQTKKSTP